MILLIEALSLSTVEVPQVGSNIVAFMIRDLCQTKSQEEQFFSFIGISNSFRSFPMPKIYEQYRIGIQSRWKSFVNAKAARDPIVHTLLYTPTYGLTQYPDEPFPSSNFKLPQLLDLQDARTDYIGFPEELTTLFNLRYLALANERVIRVPPTIANLWNLETFIITNFLKLMHVHYKIVLPDTIWKIKRLRHVDLGDTVFVHLDSEVGKDSSKLPNVESFSSATIAHGKGGEELLRRLSNARKLSCRLRTSWNQKKKCHQLPTLDHLTMLESLNIYSNRRCYPCVFSLPATLKKLSLSSFRLPRSEFPTIIGKLPSLEILKLMSDAFEGCTWDMEEGEYPSLKYLKLEGLDVTHWIASVDSFPFLEHLIVNCCSSLMEIPACFGEMPTMKSIGYDLSNNGVEESAMKIQKEQREMGNESFEVQFSELDQERSFERLRKEFIRLAKSMEQLSVAREELLDQIQKETLINAD